MKDIGFVNACELSVGDKLTDSDGKVMFIESVNTEVADEAVYVYNFQVEGTHTYYVSDECILVHNAESNYSDLNISKGRKYSVDQVMFSDDEAAGVLRNGSYIKNPTAKNINEYIKESSNYLGNKHMNGNYMYVIDMNDNIIIGNRAGQRMPHPTLVGGSNPQVQAAGMIDIRGGKIYSINNASGHYKPSNECLIFVKEKFSELPNNIFRNDFKGYISFE